MADGPITNGLQEMHPGELLREDVTPALGGRGQRLPACSASPGRRCIRFLPSAHL